VALPRACGRAAQRGDGTERAAHDDGAPGEGHLAGSGPGLARPALADLVDQLGVADAGGQVRQWNFEAASPSGMEKKGWQKDTLKEGEQITIQGYRAKSDPFVAAARMITLPDGKSMSSADEDDGGPKN